MFTNGLGEISKNLLAEVDKPVVIEKNESVYRTSPKTGSMLKVS